jgi:hypothetical protein
MFMKKTNIIISVLLLLVVIFLGYAYLKPIKQLTYDFVLDEKTAPGFNVEAIINEEPPVKVSTIKGKNTITVVNDCKLGTDNLVKITAKNVAVPDQVLQLDTVDQVNCHVLMFNKSKKLVTIKIKQGTPSDPVAAIIAKICPKGKKK